MTELLFLDDSYLREFDAAVAQQAESRVALDRTAFYPGGGGLPHDTGVIRWDGGDARVAEVRKDEGVVWHVLDGPVPAGGTWVHGSVDWDRRYGVMRHHTALHVLVGVTYHLFNALVTGGQIYADRARMDFSLGDLSKDRVAQIEAEANRVIGEHRAVLVRSMPREEFERHDLVRLAKNLVPAELAVVRVVEIEGFDAQADGGTHVRNTSEIGALRITKTENKGRQNRRLEIALD